MAIVANRTVSDEDVRQVALHMADVLGIGWREMTAEDRRFCDFGARVGLETIRLLLARDSEASRG